ncbi:hypothetical protein VUR80DRAFT_288 [Thermomyces stellatus]
MAADISVRRHIRWIPAPASEPTSTIVLTSPGRRFVDIRIRVAPGPEMGQLDWAFAGTSSSEPGPEPRVRRAVWKHWVDSSTPHAETVRDEAEVREAEDDAGTELETGRMVNPATGVEADYEEAWVSAEVLVTGSQSEGRPVTAVVQTCDDERQVRGMVVRVGQFCQGILRVGEAVTVERWEWRLESGWTLSKKFGEEELPVEALLRDAERLVVGGIIENGGRVWRILEAEK